MGSVLVAQGVRQGGDRRRDVSRSEGDGGHPPLGGWVHSATIATITGHSLSEAANILDKYSARTSEIESQRLRSWRGDRK